ncbi:phage minor head protein [Bacillus sp. MMSF_3328]|uniref:phage minor head protein n=1 Tax=Bacillus sp. MMSF_3328 TaxID=3047080 RepID=UPI00273E3F9A|nr:phage minor head protein [Bacillus sp. MMSF_3328]
MVAFWDKFFKKSNAELRNVVSKSVMSAVRALPRDGKQTSNKWEQQWFWYEGLIKRKDYRTKEVMENLKIIRDLNPDASMAIWNFLRLANSGHTLEAVTPNGRPEKATTDLLNSYAPRVGKLYGGGLDQLINVLLLTAFTQGAIALEVELTEDISDIVDFHAVDPSTLDFVRNKETGVIELVQVQWDGQYKVLNPETVFYYPIDPDISDPHGRSPILPILQIIFFQIQVLKDLQKVIHHQGYDRFDISIVEEAIMENLPDHIKNSSPEEVQRYVTSYITDVQKQMEELEPDDDFYHTSSIEIKSVGANKNVSMSAQGVIDIINQQVVTALKQLPILLGRNEGTTETHGTVQWQIYVAGIESIQRALKRILEKAYNVVLQVNGRQLQANLEFNQLRVSDRQAEANAEKTETETKIMQRKEGWITNDEAAMEMVGHNAVAEPEAPVVVSPIGGTTDNNQDDNANNDEAQRILRLKKKSRADEPDEFIVSTGDPWADDLGKLTVRSKRAFKKLMDSQLDKYLVRLRNSSPIPTRILYNAMTRADEPDADFESWVRAEILTDSEEQMSLWDELGQDWILQAAILAGEAALVELTTQIDFNAKDERLLRWLSNRARREAELIQGATDRDVIMTLWDVVADGKFTIPKAARALEDAYSFSPSRAETIARTEIISAGRSGQYFADIQSGMVVAKTWMAAQQDRTRDGHRKADGQTVAVDKPFRVANGSGELESLLFPGDTSLGATASNVIMCRCWYKRILEGEDW